MRGNCGRLLGGRQRDGDRLRRAGGPHRSSGARGRARAGERGEHRDSAAAAAAAVDQPQPRQLHVRRAHVFGKAQDQRAVVQVQGRGAGQAGRRRVALDAHAPPRHLGDAVARKVPDRALADAQEQLPALGGRGAVRQHGLGPLGGRQHHHGGIRRGALPGRGAGQAGKSPRRPAPASAAGRRNADLRRVDPCRIDRLGKPQAELAGVQVQHGDHRGRQRGRVGVARDVELHVGSPAKPVARQVADCAGLDVQADGRGRRVGGGNSRKVAVVEDEHRRCAARPAVGAARAGAGKRRPARAVAPLYHKPRRVDRLRVDMLVECNGERPGGKVEHGERIGHVLAAPQPRPDSILGDRQPRGAGRIDGVRRVARQVRERAGAGGQPQCRACRMRGDGRRLLGGRQRDDDGPRRVGGKRQRRIRPRPGLVRPRRRRRAEKRNARRLQRAGGSPCQRQLPRVGRRRIGVLVEPHGQRAGPQVQHGRPARVDRRACAVGPHLEERRAGIVCVVRQVGERAGGHF